MAEKELYQQIKEMYESGIAIREIEQKLHIGNCKIYRVLSRMGVQRRRVSYDESKLVYADKKVELKKVVINGKRYIDVTPIFAPR